MQIEKIVGQSQGRVLREIAIGFQFKLWQIGSEKKASIPLKPYVLQCYITVDEVQKPL